MRAQITNDELERIKRDVGLNAGLEGEGSATKNGATSEAESMQDIA